MVDIIITTYNYLVYWIVQTMFHLKLHRCKCKAQCDSDGPQY